MQYCLPKAGQNAAVYIAGYNFNLAQYELCWQNNGSLGDSAALC
jgi:hypothetical protein